MSRSRTGPDVRRRLRIRAARLARLRTFLRRALLVSLFAGLAVAGWMLPRAAIFDVSQVEVAGASIVSDLDVREQVDPLLAHETVFTTDYAEVRKAVEQLPFVRAVTVSRRLPSGVLVEVEEYEPLAYAIIGGEGWLVAHDGRVLSKADLQAWQSQVPVVRLGRRSVRAGDRVGDEPVLRLLQAVPPTFPGAVDTVIESDEGLVAELRSGVKVVLGRPDDLETKLEVTARLLAVLPKDQRGSLQYIDVSVAARPAIRA